MYKREERILIHNPTPHLHGSIASTFDFEDGGHAGDTVESLDEIVAVNKDGEGRI